jgi:hypothetical protein
LPLLTPDRRVENREWPQAGLRFDPPALSWTKKLPNLIHLRVEEGREIRGGRGGHREDARGQIIPQLLPENLPQQVAEERNPGLHVNVELAFRDLQQVVMRRVAQPVDRLQCEACSSVRNLTGPPLRPRRTQASKPMVSLARFSRMRPPLCRSAAFNNISKE